MSTGTVTSPKTKRLFLWFGIVGIVAALYVNFM